MTTKYYLEPSSECIRVIGQSTCREKVDARARKTCEGLEGRSYAGCMEGNWARIMVDECGHLCKDLPWGMDIKLGSSRTPEGWHSWDHNDPKKKGYYTGSSSELSIRTDIEGAEKKDQAGLDPKKVGQYLFVSAGIIALFAVMKKRK